MTMMRQIFKALIADECGATAVEYGLIAALIVVALLGGITAVSDANDDILASESKGANGRGRRKITLGQAVMLAMEPTTCSSRPPILLPCPPRYLVSECTTMSAPWSNGRHR